jgi:hypothetical protein
VSLLAGAVFCRSRLAGDGGHKSAITGKPAPKEDENEDSSRVSGGYATTAPVTVSAVEQQQ